MGLLLKPREGGWVFSDDGRLSEPLAEAGWACTQAVEDAPSAEAAPAEGEAAGAPAEAQEPKEENLGDKDELWIHKWDFGVMETIQSEAFYRMIGRTGITYGDTFRMVRRVSSHDGDAMMRWASCRCSWATTSPWSALCAQDGIRTKRFLTEEEECMLLH